MPGMTPSGRSYSLGVDKGISQRMNVDLGGIVYSVEAETRVSSRDETDRVAGSHDGFFTIVSNSDVEEKRLGEVEDKINGASTPSSGSYNDEASQALIRCARSSWYTESVRGLFLEVEAEAESQTPESVFTRTGEIF